MSSGAVGRGFAKHIHKDGRCDDENPPQVDTEELDSHAISPPFDTNVSKG
eukprot:CAMPEP_0184723658 /NCGR_PEP_ID=MMETSP0314-20130426/25754_1 /TAXON_ID=38298 /ORGANISM="Rhodella maculata, Strain CCMP 736" /LENGTH=49 /DNA_ID= /DNA_START= /DNA_END= /DNA_ORIENTATION=